MKKIQKGKKGRLLVRDPFNEGWGSGSLQIELIGCVPREQTERFCLGLQDVVTYFKTEEGREKVCLGCAIKRNLVVL